jgi:hypothetical protein
MNATILIMLLGTCALLLGCGGASGTDTPTTTSLQNRVKQYSEAYEQREWLTMYSLNSPRFRAECTAADYAAGINAGLAALGARTDSKIELEGADVREDGDLGYVKGKVKIDDVVVLDQDGQTPSWKKIDGQWYYESPDWMGAGCG